VASNPSVHPSLINQFEQILRGDDLEPLPDLHQFKK
jgi:hypothetical protein